VIGEDKGVLRLTAHSHLANALTLSRIFHPRTRLGRVTLSSGGLSLLLLALRLITGSVPGSKLDGWTRFAAAVFASCAIWLALRWALPLLMWRLRHRLMAAYVFIGVIPIVLLLIMAGIGSYLVVGQFATYVAISDLQSVLDHLRAENEALAAHLNTLNRSGKLNRRSAADLAGGSEEDFPQRTVSVWRAESGFVANSQGAADASPDKVPASAKGDFSGFVLDRDRLHLRSVKRFDDGLVVISSVPVTSDLLQPAAARLGSVAVFLPDRGGDLRIPPPANPSPDARAPVNAGSVPPPSYRFDPVLRLYTMFGAVDWETGKQQEGGMGVITRPSLLYATLFGTLSDETEIVLRGLLIAIAIFFGLIELAALYIGVRLSRGMTRSVAELYQATAHVERGDLTHRIRVRAHDQMASLEQSFNSMTESLEKLLVEQKEKQRLESELAIGHEVQGSLFPHDFVGLPSFEVYGVCQAARTVSGDYYDFIPLGADRLVLAVGDISGKGISAALLMATVHAFVRAYTLEPQRATGPNGPAGDAANLSQPTPSLLMATLNYQLFRGTPREKYATMFLGYYDSALHQLKYSNAGHLAPILLRADESILRLDTSGTVVGLFDRASYGESTVAMLPGDILVAFTDGVTEPENGSGEFGEERLIALIQDRFHDPLPNIAAAVTNAVADWIGEAEQPDDVTVVLARAI
jgi:phosphoserine phosphatase RsbU/P